MHILASIARLTMGMAFLHCSLLWLAASCVRVFNMQAAAIAQQTLVLVCWLTERYLVEGPSADPEFQTSTFRFSQMPNTAAYDISVSIVKFFDPGT